MKRYSIEVAEAMNAKNGDSMSVCSVRVRLLGSCALVSLCCLGGLAFGQAPENQPAPEAPPAPQAQPHPPRAGLAHCRPSTWKPARKNRPGNRPRSGRPLRNRRDPASRPSKPSRSGKPRRKSPPSTPPRGTTFHAGYARYFTPPPQTIAAPVNLALFANTTAQPSQSLQDPVLPERANVYDVGVNQAFSRGCAPLPGGTFTKAPRVSSDCERLELGIDAYYKTAKDLLDDGQFGAALVLSGFNYEKAYNEGVELSAKYNNGNFAAYGNLAWGIQKGTNIVSNQFLFDNTTPLATLGGLTEFQYIQSHYIFTDHTQMWTGSAGVSYLWSGTLFSVDMIYGSGFRSGDANTDHLPAYTQVNAGISHEFVGWNMKPLTVRSTS
jgi:hypothetical protein